MPLYEYRCLNCDAHFEKIQKFSDPPIKTCEACGGKLEQLLSSPAIQFKGTGWYITDYAKKSSAQSSSKDDGAPKKQEAGTKKQEAGSEKQETRSKDHLPTSDK